jgi:hypothetical protein
MYRDRTKKFSVVASNFNTLVLPPPQDKTMQDIMPAASATGVNLLVQVETTMGVFMCQELSNVRRKVANLACLESEVPPKILSLKHCYHMCLLFLAHHKQIQSHTVSCRQGDVSQRHRRHLSARSKQLCGHQEPRHGAREDQLSRHCTVIPQSHLAVL